MEKYCEFSILYYLFKVSSSTRFNNLILSRVFSLTFAIQFQKGIHGIYSLSSANFFAQTLSLQVKNIVELQNGSLYRGH